MHTVLDALTPVMCLQLNPHSKHIARIINYI